MASLGAGAGREAAAGVVGSADVTIDTETPVGVGESAGTDVAEGSTVKVVDPDCPNVGAQKMPALIIAVPAAIEARSRVLNEVSSMVVLLSNIDIVVHYSIRFRT